MPSFFKSSLYNHAFPHKGSVLVFNGLSSALINVQAPLFEQLRPLMSGQPFDVEAITDAALQKQVKDLHAARFFLDVGEDELEILRRRFATHKQAYPLSLTIATTMDCNLGCYYCFEEKSPTYMDKVVCDHIYAYATRKIETEDLKRLYVHWFGGEPMLNPEVIEYLSGKFMEFCRLHGVKYVASMISNGTNWPEKPEEAVAFVKRNRIQQIQFTFDGLPEHHNKRRRYLTPGAKRSSFDAMTDAISSLLGHTHMALRMNCDPETFQDVYALVDMFVERGWLYPGSGVYPYAAKIRPATETCDFLHNYKVENTEFNKLDNELRRYIAGFVDPREAGLRIYPKAVKLTCDAVNPNGLMIGPDGALYKCTEDMGSLKMSHGNIRDRVLAANTPTLLPIIAQPHECGAAANDYDGFSPFDQPTCSVCKYLPQCMSGCPKQQLEKHRLNQNRANIDVFKQYWDESLEALITTYADIAMTGEKQPEAVADESFEEYLQSVRQESSFFGIS